MISPSCPTTVKGWRTWEATLSTQNSGQNEGPHARCRKWSKLGWKCYRQMLSSNKVKPRIVETVICEPYLLVASAFETTVEGHPGRAPNDKRRTLEKDRPSPISKSRGTTNEREEKNADKCACARTLNCNIACSVACLLALRCGTALQQRWLVVPMMLFVYILLFLLPSAQDGHSNGAFKPEPKTYN
ncbi:hypothetical protein IWX49DRAFT_424316 [Phyllosticta citricarpa]|uniref:Uncharacterized protein n=1 Tax=Phyllosticta citricarpa TaxID=55181 RepID=A0ABR1M8G5_9PEZI